MIFSFETEDEVLELVFEKYHTNKNDLTFIPPEYFHEFQVLYSSFTDNFEYRDYKFYELKITPTRTFSCSKVLVVTKKEVSTGKYRGDVFFKDEHDNQFVFSVFKGSLIPPELFKPQIQTAIEFCCPICGSNNYVRIHQGQEVLDSLPKRTANQLYSCTGCTVVFRNPTKFSKQVKKPTSLAQKAKPIHPGTINNLVFRDSNLPKNRR